MAKGFKAYLMKQGRNELRRRHAAQLEREVLKRQAELKIERKLAHEQDKQLGLIFLATTFVIATIGYFL